MAENSIDLVRQAEVKAEEVARNATQQAAEIVDDAYTKATALENQAEDDAKNKAASDVAAAHQASQQVLQAAMGELDTEMQALTEKARGNQVEAVMSVLRSLA